MLFDIEKKELFEEKIIPCGKFWYVDFQPGWQVSKILWHFPLAKNRCHVMMGVTSAADTHFKEQVPLDVLKKKNAALVLVYSNLQEVMSGSNGRTGSLAVLGHYISKVHQALRFSLHFLLHAPSISEVRLLDGNFY